MATPGEIASIGIAIATDGISKGITSLRQLASQGKPTQAAMDGVAKSSQDAAKAVASAAQEAGKASASQQRLQQAVNSLNETELKHLHTLGLQTQRLQMSNAERQSYIARSKGMSQAAQDIAKAIGKQADELKRLQEAAKKSDSALKSMASALAPALSVGAITAFVKSGIEAAQAMDDFRKRTGVAAEEVAGLKLAASQSGMPLSQLESALNNLAGKASANHAAFAKMGIELKNSAGELRPTRELLSDIADRFATYDDGAAKAALSSALFGEAGARMIPMLNDGASALADMDDMAAKLGMTMSQEAMEAATALGGTIDLLKQSIGATAQNIGVKLTPTLQTMVSDLIDVRKNTDFVTIAAGALELALKTLYSAGTILATGLKNLGRDLGAMGAAFGAFVRGKWGAARDIMRDSQAENEKSTKDALERIKRIWAGQADASVAEMAKVVGAAKESAPVIASEFTKAAGGVGKARDAIGELLERLSSAEMGISRTFLKELDLLKQAYDNGRISVEEYNHAVQQLTAEQPYAKAAVKQLRELEQARTKDLQTAKAAADEVQKSNITLRDEIERIGKTKQELRELEAQKLADEIATKRQTLATAEASGMGQDYLAILRQEIQLLQERGALMEERDQRGDSYEQQDEAVEYWQNITKEMGRIFTDAIIQGGANAKTAIKRMFVNLVLQPIVAPIMGNIAGSITSAIKGMVGGGQTGQMGGGQTGQMGGGLGGLTNWSTWGASASSWLSNTGFNLANTNNLGTMANSFGNAMGSLGNTIAKWDTALQKIPGMSGGLGSLAGYAQSIYALGQGNYGEGVAAAIGTYIMPGIGTMVGSTIGTWIDKAFSSRGANHAGGVYSTLTTDRNLAAESLGLRGNALGDFTKRGIEEIDKSLKGTVNSLLSTYNDLALRAGDTAKKLDIVAGFATNPKYTDEDAYAYFKIFDKTFGSLLYDYSKRDKGLGSDTEKAYLQFTTDMAKAMLDQLGDSLPGWMKQQFDKIGDDFTLEGFDAAIQTILAVDSLFNGLGKTMQNLAGVSDDVKTELINLAGGVESFAAGLSSYYDKFYSAEEKRLAQAEELANVLQNIGLDFDPSTVLSTTKEQYRELINAQDLTTESGRELWGALIALSDSFAEVAEVTDQFWETLHDERLSADIELLRALGKEEEALAKERENAIKGLNKEQIEYYDTTQAIKKQTEALKKLEDEVKEVTNIFDEFGNLTQGFIGGVQESMSTTSSTMTSALAEGLVGSWEGEDLGAYLADTLQNGVYNAIAGGFANEITNIIMTGIVNPMIQAALTGSSVVGAVSSQTIAQMVEQARQVAEIAHQVMGALKDSGVFEEIRAGFGEISESVRRDTYVTTTTARPAVQAVENIGKTWKDMLEDIKKDTLKTQQEMAKIGKSDYEKSLMDVDFQAQEKLEKLREAGYMQSETTKLERLQTQGLQHAMQRLAAAERELQKPLTTEWLSQVREDYANYDTRYKEDRTESWYNQMFNLAENLHEIRLKEVESAQQNLANTREEIAKLEAEIAKMPPELVEWVKTQKELIRAQREAAFWEQLRTERFEIENDLLRAQGKEAEALAREREKAIDGMNAEQIAYYDATQAMKQHIEQLEKWEQLREDRFAAEIELLNRTGYQQAALALEREKAIEGMNAEQIAYYDTTQAIRAHINAIDASYATLQRAVDAERKALDEQEKAIQERQKLAKESVSEINAVFEAARDGAKALFGEVESVVVGGLAQNRKFITDALYVAQTTGYLPEADKLRDVISQVQKGFSGTVYATQAESDFERLVVANELKKLEDISGRQKTESERMADGIEAQLEEIKIQRDRLDQILEDAKNQIDALNGIDQSIISVDAAVAQMQGAITSAQQVAYDFQRTVIAGELEIQTGLSEDQKWLQTKLLENATYQYNEMLIQTATLEETYNLQAELNTELFPTLFTKIFETTYAVASSQIAIVNAIQSAASSIASSVSSAVAASSASKTSGISVPKYHSGTAYVPQEQLALLQKGEMVVPAAFNPAVFNQTDNKSEELIERLIAEVVELRKQIDVTNKNTQRTAEAVNGRPEQPMLVESV